MDKTRLAILGAVVVLALALGLMLTRTPATKQCYKDACLVGSSDPRADMAALINGSGMAILVMEADNSLSELTSYMSQALISLSKDFGARRMNITLVTLGLDDGNAVRCLYTTMSGNSTEKPVDFCKGISPGDGELMIVLKYPDSGANEIAVSGRTIEFRSRSGLDCLALVKEVFEKVFF